MRLLNSNETNNMEFLTEKGIPFTLIEPTQTGLKKSIMDATSTVRFFLETNSIHDYKQQKQGVDNKLIYPATITIQKPLCIVQKRKKVTLEYGSQS